jgi:Cof subfamily protein (haloacid dehalogenase superfamily)
VTTSGDIKLLISDVDGTLVPHDKTLSPAAVGAAADLRRAGVGLALTSSRPPRGMRMLIEPLGIELPLAGFNGGLIVDAKLSEIESHPIAPAAVGAALRLLKDSGLDVWIYTDKAWLVTRADGPHVARESWIVQMDPEIAPPSTSGGLGRVFKIVGVSDDFPKVAAVEAAAQRQLDGAASVFRSADHFLDVTDVKATKGCVARSLATRLNLTRAQIASIGDSPNDVSMFAESGLSIAMGNASDEVKASADAVTDSNEHDGFAKAVRRFVLAPAPTEAEDRSPP